MILVNVYDREDAEAVLYALLKERDGRDDINISHQRMPTFDEHQEFVRSRPYRVWYLIGSTTPPGAETAIPDIEQAWYGSIYLTKQREVGVFIFERHQGKGIGKAAIEELRRRWPGRMLANVNPANTRSAQLFTGLGFKVLQITYEAP